MDGIPTGWHKSTYSGATNECVEVAETPETVWVQDTANRGLGQLAFSSSAWADFLTSVKRNGW